MPIQKHKNAYLPAHREKLFYAYWAQLSTLNRLPQGDQILCPMCLRPRYLEKLTVEHIIPKRALKHDPQHLRAHFLNNRSGLTLLCAECNRTKGRYYDQTIEKLDTRINPVKVGEFMILMSVFKELGIAYASLCSDEDFCAAHCGTRRR